MDVLKAVGIRLTYVMLSKIAHNDLINKILFIFIFVFLFSLGVLMFELFTRGEMINVRAIGKVKVIANSNYAESKDVIVGILNVGESAEVLECVDLKTDIILKVRLKSGRKGYIVMGSYEFERRNISIIDLLSPSKIVLSCNGYM